MKTSNKFIYESPDNGKTIYKRKFNDIESKQLHSVSDETITVNKINNELKIWKKIIETSLVDNNLAKELERVKMLFYLKKHGSKT